MKLRQLTEHVYYLPQDDFKDRPMLGYIKGENYSIAVDGGFSPDHVKVFYDELRQNGLREPDFTVLTHWHWDHTLGLHAISGALIASRATDDCLRAENEKLADPSYERELRRGYTYVDDEFRGTRVPLLRTADIEFEDGLRMDAGGVTAVISRVDSPHTDDSVMISVPEERVLFLGDASLGSFENGGAYDVEKLNALTDAVAKVDCDTILQGHQVEIGKDDFLFNMTKLRGWLSTGGTSVTSVVDELDRAAKNR